MVLNNTGRRYYPATTTADGLMTTTDRIRLDYLWLVERASCRVYNSAAISVASAALTALTFNSERYDATGCHSTSVNTGRITVPAGWGGVWRLTGYAEFATAAGGGRRAAFLRVNGTTYIAVQETAPTANVLPGLNPTADYTLAAGDYVELVAYQDSGGALNVVAQPSYSPEISAEWLHP